MQADGFNISILHQSIAIAYSRSVFNDLKVSVKIKLSMLI